MELDGCLKVEVISGLGLLCLHVPKGRENSAVGAVERGGLRDLIFFVIKIKLIMFCVFVSCSECLLLHISGYFSSIDFGEQYSVVKSRY